MRTRAGGVLGFFAFAGAVLFWQARTSTPETGDASIPRKARTPAPTKAPPMKAPEAPQATEPSPPEETPEPSNSRPRAPIGPLLLDVALPREGIPEPTLTSPDDLQAAIDDGVRPLLEDIHRCVMDWAAVDPELSGEVVLELEFGPEGLQQVHVLGHTEMPTGVTSCFAATLWEGEWPATEEAVSVDYPFTFELVKD